MAPWTLQERMTLHVLFGHHRLDFYGPAWWALHRDITHTDRTERTCREDYKYSHGKERTKMYPMRILKPYAQYDAEERVAYDKAFRDVIESAKRQGIALPGSDEGHDEDGKIEDAEEKEDEDEDKVEDEEDEDEVLEADESQDEEAEEIEEDGDEADENEDEVDGRRTDNGDEDVEMEDAEYEYATAQEDGFDGDNSPQNDATAHEGEAIDKFEMPDFSDDTLWDQQNPNMLAEAGSAATGNARAVLSTAIGARETSRKSANVSAIPETPVSSAYPLLAHLRTVARLNPTIAAGLSSVNSIVVVEPAANTPALPATSSGIPRKHSRRRPKQLKVEIEDDPAVTVGAPKSGRRRSKKQFSSVGDFTSAYVGDTLNERSEEKTRVFEVGLAKKTKDDTVKNRKSLGDLDGPLETMETPGITSKKPSRKQVAFDWVTFDAGTSKKPATRVQLIIDKLSKPSTRDQDRIKKQVKLATSEVTLPLMQATQKVETTDALPVRGQKYDIWCRENLDRILLAEPFNMFPNRVIVPGSRRTGPEDPLSAEERVTNFFFDMFDGQLTKKVILSTFERVEESDRPGRRLKKVYKILVDKAKEMSADPRYNLNKVFESEESPFSNFRLATTAFGQDLKMLHMSDVDYTGVGDQQLVAFAKTKSRHLTADDIDFISPDDPIFKRGGRVHKLWIREQECPILGDCKKYNTAYVCIDVMICQEAHCPKCSKDENTGSQLKSITTLPRVHSRHITRGNKFVAPLLKISRAYEKDYKDEFIVDVNIGVQSVELWDGTTQDVVVCDRASCPGCFEASGGIVKKPKADGNLLEERETAETHHQLRRGPSSDE